jgi:uncharacterized protein
MRRLRNNTCLWDLDTRFRIIDQYPDYRQVLTLASPPIEGAADASLAPDLARLANDEMAALVETYPDRFVASLPMNAAEAIVPEIDRAITQLGATGVQIFTNVNDKALDRPEFHHCSLGWPRWTCRSGSIRRGPLRSPLAL